MRRCGRLATFNRGDLREMHVNVISKWLIPALLLIAGGSVAFSAIAEEEQAVANSPVAMIEFCAAALAAQLEGRQDYFAQHNAELFDIVDEILLPGFDVPYASKLVLGREHWTAASLEQRERFIETFYGFLVRTYSKGLIGFNQKNMSVTPEPSYSRDGSKALVRTTIMLDGSGSVQINYALLKTDDVWRIYDVRIDGVSYIQNYRSQFDAEISARGINAVIERLEAEASAAEPVTTNEDSADAA